MCPRLCKESKIEDKDGSVIPQDLQLAEETGQSKDSISRLLVGKKREEIGPGG